MKTVFVHPERCIGCKQCEVACAVAHSQNQNLFLAVFESPAPKPRIHTEPGLAMNTSFPNKCRHCNPGPCMGVCPTAALYRPADYPNIVMVDVHKCIACGMCAMVCPFDVITYYPLAAAPERPIVAVKCDHCIERQRMGLLPACVQSCKSGALEFGEINELTKAARTRYSENVFAAIGQDAEKVSPLPASIKAWRGFGASVTQLNSKGKKGV
jgi:anaerobic carbon-monoxide dehydrogenase iron sulfur subunit